MIPLTQQVSSLVLSQKLKELGVKQESLFTWYLSAHMDEWGNVRSYCSLTTKKERSTTADNVSAFTVAELDRPLDVVEEEISEYRGHQIMLYGDKLPFVVFGGKADEVEKNTIYDQAFKDIISRLSEIRKGINS